MFERLGVRERVGVVDRECVNHTLHGYLADLPTDRARNRWDLNDDTRHVARRGVFSDLAADVVPKRGIEPRPIEAYVYEPRQPREQAIISMVREFVNRVFDGSAQPLLLHLVEDHRVSEQDLREITRMIKERQGGETWAPCS